MVWASSTCHAVCVTCLRWIRQLKMKVVTRKTHFFPKNFGITNKNLTKQLSKYFINTIVVAKLSQLETCLLNNLPNHLREKKFFLTSLLDEKSID
jgi:hypothetical protein